MEQISVVAPVYNELRETLYEFVSQVNEVLSKITGDYEIILVDDGSENDAWKHISALAASDRHVRGLRLARNFGQHVAITAGLDHADGDWAVVMDADLQDRPAVIPDLLAKAHEGYDAVFVDRQQRPESLLYQGLAATFYRLLNMLSGQEHNRLHGNFSIISAAVVRAFRSMREQTRFYGGMVRWMGFKQTSIVSKHGTRFAGPPAYDITKRFKLAFDLTVGFSTRILYTSIILGSLMAMSSFGMAAYVVARTLAHPELPVPGWSSVMTAVMFTAGVTNVMVGLTGIYIGKIFEQSKSRPIYILKQTAGLPLEITAGVSLFKEIESMKETGKVAA